MNIGAVLHGLGLATAGGAVAAAAALFAASLRLPSFTAWALAAYLVASAEVVALLEGLSAAEISRLSVAAGEAVVLAIASAVWWIRARPLPALPRLRLGAAIGERKLLCIFAILVAAALAYELAIGLLTPPNNGDSLTYHLTRAAAWLNERGVHRIPGPAKTAENDYPPNAEIQILYTFVFLRGDAAAALVQFLAQGALMFGVYGCARRLPADPPAALFAALVVPTLSVVTLESMTTQNDLLVASYVVAAAYFFRSHRTVELGFGGLAVGLALGTKFTAIFALPALALIAFVSLPRRRLAAAAAAALAGFAVVGSYAYVRNVIASGSPLGRLEGEPGANRPSITPIGTVSTISRDLYRFIDLSGYPFDAITYLRPIAGAARRLFALAHVPENPPESTGFPFSFAINTHPDEDLSFFGPLGALLIVPLSIWIPLRRARTQATRAAAAHALALPLYLLAMAFGYRYSGQGRFLITGVALMLPTVAFVYARRTLAAAVAAIALISLALTLVYNEMKPTGFGGTTAIWNLPDSKARTLRSPAEMWFALEAINREVPDDARLGVVVGEHDADYLLYGPTLRRHLVPLPADQPLRTAKRLGLRWVYLGRFYPKLEVAPADWTVERLSDAGTLLTRSPRRVVDSGSRTRRAS